MINGKQWKKINNGDLHLLHTYWLHSIKLFKNIKNKATKHVSDSGTAKLIAELRGHVGSLAAELLRVRKGGDPESGTSFTLSSLEMLSKGQSTRVGSTAVPFKPPPQDLETVNETDKTLSNGSNVASNGDKSDLQATLEKPLTTEEKLAQMTKERNELKKKLEEAGINILGTSTKAINLAEEIDDQYLMGKILTYPTA